MEVNLYPAVFVGVYLLSLGADHMGGLHALDIGRVGLARGTKLHRRWHGCEAVFVSRLGRVHARSERSLMSLVSYLGDQVIDILLGPVVLRQVEAVPGRHGPAVSVSRHLDPVHLQLFLADRKSTRLN